MPYLEERVHTVEADLTDIKDTLRSHSVVLAEHSTVLAEHSTVLAEHSTVLAEHSRLLETQSIVLAGHSRALTSLERNAALMRDDIGELKAGQVEIRDLLSRVVSRLESVAS
ncbi:hypothetical protein [Sphaerisporangium sp. TRM90804]|uniref:hypothetical protein n=1 Tax=Sphaerisporangium sp. TRM90804 TaxID=3031113 RepID=UPI00244C6899|nr:hypothetical protein [Sphaerisporangium sp. TRM90804]MDH2424439.1 hypothetical protein [Sphaerisporangium sp. TRM90804]